MATTRVAQLDAVVQRGRGVAAKILGQTWNVYRLGSNAMGQVVQPSNLVLSNYPGIIKREQKIADIEVNWGIKVPLFKFLGDASKLQIGDVLVETGYLQDGTVLTFAYRRPISHQAIFVHTPVAATITRAENNPSGALSGEIAYSGMMKPYEQTLILVSGGYEFQAVGGPQAAATVYVGLQNIERGGEYPSAKLRLATDVKRANWHCYVPLLSSPSSAGIEIMETDIINGANGDRYFVRSPFFQTVGLVGYQLLLEKIRV